MMEFCGKGLVGYGNQIAAEAGLFPASDLATVSINLLRAEIGRCDTP